MRKTLTTNSRQESNARLNVLLSKSKNGEINLHEITEMLRLQKTLVDSIANAKKQLAHKAKSAA